MSVQYRTRLVCYCGKEILGRRDGKGISHSHMIKEKDLTVSADCSVKPLQASSKYTNEHQTNLIGGIKSRYQTGCK